MLHLAKIPKQEKDPLTLARANLIFEEYCQKGIYSKRDKNKTKNIIEEYLNDIDSVSYLLFDLKNDGVLEGQTTVTYTIKEFQKLPSFKKGFWRDKDIKIIMEKKGFGLEEKIAELNKFATKTKRGKNPSVNLIRLYGKIFPKIKKQTDHVLISSCRKNLENYMRMGLGEAFLETEHYSEKLNGKDVVVGYIGLSNLNIEKSVHKLLKRMGKKETTQEYLENLKKTCMGYAIGMGHPLWNCI